MRTTGAGKIAGTLAGVLSLLFTVARGAEPPNLTSFAQGNAAYEAGNFSEAAAAYQREVHAGRSGANLFYNLGDTYYHLGDLGRATLNYQRALLLEPGHAEAAANLAYVRGKTAARSLPPGNLFTPLRDTLATLDVDSYAVIAATAGWLALAGLCLAWFTRRRRTLGWVMLGLALPVFAACAGTLFWLEDGRKNPGRGIVLKDQTPAHYAPADSAKVIVKLPVGEEVRVLSEHGAWTYAQLADGARAWLPADAVERIIPKDFLPSYRSQKD